MFAAQFIVGIIGITSGKTAVTSSGVASVRAMIAFICLDISAFAMTVSKLMGKRGTRARACHVEAHETRNTLS